MEIKILGATGFIGKSLLGQIPDSQGVSLRNADWQKQLSDAKVWINLIGKAHDHKGTATYQDFHFANVELIQQIFNEFIKSDVELMIHISSIAALEEFSADTPLEENHTCRPHSHYGKTKRQAEEWLLSQKIPNDKKLVILRPPMVHGAGDKGNLGLLYKLISKGIPYPLASFENNRSFISVDNFVYLIKTIIEKHQNLDNGIYHIADDEPISTNELIEIIKKVEQKNTMNLSLPKFFVKAVARLGDFLPIPLNSVRLSKMTSNLLVSTKKIKTALGIEKLPLTAEQGLEKTIKSFRN